MKTTISKIKPYITKDGSTVRELMHPLRHGNSRQSLAEATVAPYAETALHKHLRCEELYHITAGTGRVILGDASFTVKAGYTVLVRPDTPHKLTNLAATPLVLLCCCAPAYDHEDVVLLEV